MWRLILIVVLPTLVTASVSPGGGVAIASVEVLANALEAGQTLRVSTAALSFEIPLKVSSILVPEDENGTPILKEKRIVLRGNSGVATAVVGLEPGRISAVANGPDGRSYKAIYPPSKAEPRPASHGPPRPADIGGPDPPIQRVTLEELALDLDPDSLRAPLTTDGDGPMLHISPEGGHSILFSKHIKSGGVAQDPVNVVYYDFGTADWVDHVLVSSDWNNGVCGSEKNAYFFDQQHGGTNHWELEDMNYDKEAILCFDDRYHLRRYVSNTGDTHSPGFDYYTLAPVHYEDAGGCGIPHCEVYPQAGQDELYLDMVNHHDIQQMWFKQVTHTDGECASCDNWGGWVDIYQIWETWNEDPCGRNPSWTIYQWSIVSIKFTCV